jgi:hypothetical protein
MASDITPAAPTQDSSHHWLMGLVGGYVGSHLHALESLNVALGTVSGFLSTFLLSVAVFGLARRWITGLPQRSRGAGLARVGRFLIELSATWEKTRNPMP